MMFSRSARFLYYISKKVSIVQFIQLQFTIQILFFQTILHNYLITIDYRYGDFLFEFIYRIIFSFNVTVRFFRVIVKCIKYKTPEVSYFNADSYKKNFILYLEICLKKNNNNNKTVKYISRESILLF